MRCPRGTNNRKHEEVDVVVLFEREEEERRFCLVQMSYICDVSSVSICVEFLV